MKNIFLVIEGQDGCGKEKQMGLLEAKMIQKELVFNSISFPRYGLISAFMVEAYLKGEFGLTDCVDPKVASILYAQDRFAAKNYMRELLSLGHLGSNRYSSSNSGHQGGKIRDSLERQQFLNWLYDLEFNIFKNIKPDINIILGVSPEISFEVTKKRAITKGLSQDGHEADFNHIKNAAAVYRELAEIYPDHCYIDCLENGHWLAPEIIHEKIWEIVKPLLYT